MKEKLIRVKHAQLEIDINFDQFTKNLESLLGRFFEKDQQELASNPKLLQTHLKAMSEEEDLLLFTSYDHGNLLTIYGIHQKAKVYIVGNPLIAATMTKHDLRAALYAPLRVLVYEEDSGSTRIEYDLPSSLFGQFHNSEIDAVAHALDLKLKHIVELASSPRLVLRKARLR